MSTRTTLRDALRARLKIDDKKRVWSDDSLNTNLEVAKRKIQRDGDYVWHFNDGSLSAATVASTMEYALPSDFVRIEEGTVKYNGQLLDVTSLNQLKREHQALTATGSPSVYYLRGSNIGLYVIPNDALTYEFLYRAKLADFASDASDSGMPTDFDEAIVQYARYHSWNDIQGRQDFAIQAIQSYKEEMEGVYAQYLGRRDSSDFQFQFEVVASGGGVPNYR